MEEKVHALIMTMNLPKQQLLLVCRNLANSIRDCHSLSEYDVDDFWIEKQLPNETQQEITRDIRHNLVRFIKRSPEKRIHKTIASLHPATKIFLANHMPLLYRKFFGDYSKAKLPADFVSPNIFMAMNPKEGAWVPLHKKIERYYGDTRVTIAGIFLTHLDALTLIALIDIKNRRKDVQQIGNDLTFKTNLKEIARYAQSSNPRSFNHQKAIWNSLYRLTSVVVEIYKPGHYRRIGHIINSAEELLRLDETKNYKEPVTIALDARFLELMEASYASLDRSVLKKLRTKPRSSCVYHFLRRQDKFKEGRWYAILCEKLHDYSGLRPAKKSPFRIRYEVISALKLLEKEEILTWHLSKDKRLVAVQEGKTDLVPDWDKIREELKLSKNRTNED